MFLVTLGVLALCGGWAAYFFWPVIGSEYTTQKRFEKYRSSPDPLLRDLAAGKIQAGDPVEELIRTYSLEIWALRHDDFVWILHHPDPNNRASSSLRILAKDGRLFFAEYEWLDTTSDRLLVGKDIFFQEGGTEWMQAYDESYDRFIRGLRRKRMVRDAALAVAGFGATIDPKTHPTNSEPPGK
jgi:hypothetical protein